MTTVENENYQGKMLKKGRPKAIPDTDETLSTPAINIRNIREIIGMTRKEFSALTKIGESTINFYETNPNANINYDSLKKIITGLGRIGVCCSMESFYESGTLTPYFTHDFFTRFLSYRKGKVQIQSVELTQEQIIRYEVANFLMHNPDTTTITVKDDSMAPLLHRGNILGALFINNENALSSLLKLCVLVFKDPAYPPEYGILEEITTDKIVLKIMNPESVKKFAHDEIDKIAEVIWIRKKSPIHDARNR